MGALALTLAICVLATTSHAIHVAYCMYTHVVQLLSMEHMFRLARRSIALAPALLAALDDALKAYGAHAPVLRPR